MNKILSTMSIISCLTIMSCSQGDKTTRNENKISSTPKIETSPTFGINGEDIPIRQKPSDKADKVINVKATQALGETQYCEVDYSAKVKVLEKKGEWVKIKVVEPDWLSDTYIGWIPSNFLITEADQEKQSIGTLSQTDYEILKTEHNSAVENYHVLLKKKDFEKNFVYQFIKQFRKENCKGNCNVSLYDNKSISKLIGIYPLPDKDYLQMADHIISISTFDATEVRDWYPYQDFHYKDLGGKNWKKEPIK
ncbi:hypothetical protein [Sphingobacterium sp. UBA6320]|uniref:hypothetical protein n=1 Tax=Sphingobacterium sp. UBA6320 TaxID=1947510 RepID=UPI0025EFAD8B|nr:hypothetical protein [Sphingobacterium sp. UBA6320]